VKDRVLLGKRVFVATRSAVLLLVIEEEHKEG